MHEQFKSSPPVFVMLVFWGPLAPSDRKYSQYNSGMSRGICWRCRSREDRLVITITAIVMTMAITKSFIVILLHVVRFFPRTLGPDTSSWTAVYSRPWVFVHFSDFQRVSLFEQ